MKNLLLSVVLVAVPVAVFATAYPVLAPPSQTTASSIAKAGPPLGDMTPFETITTDVQSIASSGDLAAAKTRIADLETAWDDAEPKLRPVSTAEWGSVDTAIDDALAALRAPNPDRGKVDATLATLQTTLADPAAATGPTQQAGTVARIAVTDSSGHPLPCEVMLDTFRTKLAASNLSDADRAKATELQSKGTERCNADDDIRADAFLAQGLALLAN
ncbi:hypothetical protein LX81_03364 [Palleronia aestuarii]|uniref:YfdX protein n=1 Tax=Palleronia aestuarii TaxID=568105 RepID=A0A2W7N3Q6_9RHOB|nr:hypothetical protein [Palleronia aestuarii]PZX12987.1 hypothetical protein LX81_03364 [Palleronia aestuarii]